MPTKEKLIQLLQDNIGIPQSGEVLAHSIGVSRTAIWKAIQALKKDGFDIQSTMNKGYTLTSIPDYLDPILIKKQHPKWNISIMTTTTSTQENAKRYANSGEHQSAIFISEHQSAGRGRLGRTFHSPAHGGLYMSLCLFPENQLENLSLITCATAVAVAQSLERFTNETITIKWVNDLFYHHKKVCGILTEVITDMQTQQVQALIVGIGINLTPTSTLEEPALKKIAGTVFQSEKEAKEQHFSRTDFINDFLIKWQEYYDKLSSKAFLSDYKRRSLVIGREITVIQGQQEYPAKALDITDEGHLVIQQKNGIIKNLSYGEVSIRPKGENFND